MRSTQIVIYVYVYSVINFRCSCESSSNDFVEHVFPQTSKACVVRWDLKTVSVPAIVAFNRKDLRIILLCQSELISTLNGIEFGSTFMTTSVISWLHQRVSLKIVMKQSKAFKPLSNADVVPFFYFFILQFILLELLIILRSFARKTVYQHTFGS